MYGSTLAPNPISMPNTFLATGLGGLGDSGPAADNRAADESSCGATVECFTLSQTSVCTLDTIQTGAAH